MALVGSRCNNSLQDMASCSDCNVEATHLPPQVQLHTPSTLCSLSRTLWWPTAARDTTREKTCSWTRPWWATRVFMLPFCDKTMMKMKSLCKHVTDQHEQKQPVIPGMQPTDKNREAKSAEKSEFATSNNCRKYIIYTRRKREKR